MAGKDKKLYIQFYVNDNRFALPANDVIAVAPLVTLHQIPRAPDYVAGILNYHGLSVPVVDMTALMAEQKTRQRLSTRIVLIKLGMQDLPQRIIGLLAEKVTEVMRIDEEKFKDSGVKNTNAKYLGDVLTDERGILQRLNVSEILPRKVQDVLFG